MVFFANFLPATQFPNGAANRKCQELGSTAAEAATTATKVGEEFPVFLRMVFKDFESRESTSRHLIILRQSCESLLKIL